MSKIELQLNYLITSIHAMVAFRLFYFIGRRVETTALIFKKPGLNSE